MPIGVTGVVGSKSSMVLGQVDGVCNYDIGRNVSL